MARALADGGDCVRALGRSPTLGTWEEYVTCDLGRDPLPRDVFDGIDGIFHLAGVAHVQDIAGIPDAVYQRVNVEGTRALLDAAQTAGVERFVYFSSVKAAADPGSECVDEAWNKPPTDAYGRSKLEAEGLALAAAASGAMHATVLRPSLVYGRGVKGNLDRMIGAVAAGRFPPIPEFGNRRSMVSLPDLVSAAVLAMTDPKGSGRVYIVSDGVDYSTHDLFLAIRGALGRPPPAWTIPAAMLSAGGHAGDLLERILLRPMPLSSTIMARLAGSACYRSGRLRDELGWAPSQTFYDLVGEIVSEQRQRHAERGRE